MVIKLHQRSNLWEPEREGDLLMTTTDTDLQAHLKALGFRRSLVRRADPRQTCINEVLSIEEYIEATLEPPFSRYTSREIRARGRLRLDMAEEDRLSGD